MRRERKTVIGLIMVRFPASAVNHGRTMQRIILDAGKGQPARLYSGQGRPIELIIDGIRTTFGDRRPEFIIVPEEIPEVLRSPKRSR